MLGKILLIAGIVLGVGLVVVIVLGWWVYTKMTGPMYVPGGLASARIDPPSQDDDQTTWLVQREVQLSHFSIGAGRPVLFVHGGPGIPVRDPMQWLGDLDGHAVHFYDQRGCGDSYRPFDRFESPLHRRTTDVSLLWLPGKRDSWRAGLATGPRRT